MESTVCRTFRYASPEFDTLDGHTPSRGDDI